MTDNYQPGLYNQRETYKLVENLTSGKFKTKLAFLKALIRDIVANEEFEINGGRIWQLMPAESTYSLKYQYGIVKKIPANYKIHIDEQPVLKRLSKEKITLNRETDQLLLKKGIILYSIAGVGELIKLPGGKFYEFVMSFNAPEILQSFYETLAIISTVASVYLHDLENVERQKKMQQDIARASEIQRSLLPEHDYEFNDYKIFGVCIPAYGVGGDYFDYFKNPIEEEERLGIVISDAASKGLPASIQSLFMSGALRMGMSFSPKISQLFSRVNNLISESFPYDGLITAFYCELTMSSNRLVLYINAGHNEPMHYRIKKNEIIKLKPTGGLLGIMPNQKFNVENLIMNPGDVLVMYTDGISEAHDSKSNLFGEDRLEQIILKNIDKTPRDIALRIIDEVEKFADQSVYTDDKTVVVLKRDPESQS